MVRLQGMYNEYKGTKASDIKVGQKTVWNFGYTETILDILKETKTQLVWKIKCDNSGRIMERRIKKDRLVVVA